MHTLFDVLDECWSSIYQIPCSEKERENTELNFGI